MVSTEDPEIEPTSRKHKEIGHEKEVDEENREEAEKSWAKSPA